MSDFAEVRISPRSIAWILQPNDWDILVEIIHYNSVLLGGIFNVIIPTNERKELSEEYKKYLIQYDPDLIILTPEIDTAILKYTSPHLHPFAVVAWNSIGSLVSKNPLQSWVALNSPMDIVKYLNSNDKLRKSGLFAVDDESLDINRLSLVACGKADPKLVNHYNDYFIRCTISGRFPSSDAISILNACYRLQTDGLSLIGLTSAYEFEFSLYKLRAWRVIEEKPYTVITILVSESFSFDEAILFWNERARGTYVAWLSFIDLEANLESISNWISEKFGEYFENIDSSSHSRTQIIAFATPLENYERLSNLVKQLQNIGNKHSIKTQAIKYEDLIYYNFGRPWMAKSKVVISQSISKCYFVPPLSMKEFAGTQAVTLDWKGLMLPQHTEITPNLVSKQLFLPTDKLKIELSKFRIEQEHYLRVQAFDDSTIEFEKPNPIQIFNTLFSSAGFSKFALSSAAKYHNIFIERSGGLDIAAHYLSKEPYKSLLTLLANNKSKSLSGWILCKPSQRRALHHLQLREAFGYKTSEKVSDYFDKDGNLLPPEAIELLEKDLLERGFLLSCNFCSYQAWYSANDVGERFKCHSCSSYQIYKTNPFWLYKLPEVIFQGFADNMQVPLIALNHLRTKTSYCFEWVADSDIYWQENGKEINRNIDLLCLCDGKMYIGEAKSNDEIPQNQFSFYVSLNKRLAIDYYVFATTEKSWNEATNKRIEQLRKSFSGEVIVLTSKDLYL